MFRIRGLYYGEAFGGEITYYVYNLIFDDWLRVWALERGYSISVHMHKMQFKDASYVYCSGRNSLHSTKTDPEVHLALNQGDLEDYEKNR